MTRAATAVFLALVVATFGAFFLAQRLKHEPSAVKGFSRVAIISPNGDGRKELIFLETAKSYIDIVSFEAPHKLVPADRWQVFEERTFRSRRNDLSEPREAIVADVTDDGKNDLIVVVHDRIIVYPQE